MSNRRTSSTPGNVYHIYNRGVEKRDIFVDDRDRQHLRELLLYCLPRGAITSYSLAKKARPSATAASVPLPPLPKRVPAGQGLIDLLSFCFMPNHFHFLLQENVESGIAKYMQRVINSYVRYFNVRHQRTGPLFAGRFRRVIVAGDDQLIHVSRYIHLNPFVARLVDRPYDYPWSSLAEYVGIAKQTMCHTQLIKSMMKSEEYKELVSDYAGYARDLADIKHLVLEN